MKIPKTENLSKRELVSLWPGLPYFIFIIIFKTLPNMSKQIIKVSCKQRAKYAQLNCQRPGYNCMMNINFL